MIKRENFIILIASVFALVSVNASAGAGRINVPDYTACVYPGPKLAILYKSPGSNPYTSVKNNKRVRVITHEHDWRELYFDDGVRGWIHRNQLTQKCQSKHAQLTATNSHARQQTTRITNVPDYSAYVSVNSGRLNVRESPGGRVLTSVKKGTHVRVISHGGNWRRLYYSGRVQGWAHKNYLTRK